MRVSRGECRGEREQRNKFEVVMFGCYSLTPLIVIQRTRCMRFCEAPAWRAGVNYEETIKGEIILIFSTQALGV